MKLTHQQIKEITTGFCDIITEKNGDLRFSRMTSHAQKAFTKENRTFNNKAFATCGIHMDFYTDAKYVSFSFRDVREASSRRWYYFDLYVNGELFLHAGNIDCKKDSSCDFKACLDGKKNRIELFFPFSVSPALHSVELSDGASLEPVSPSLYALCYGDSITHGYDARFPSLSYINVMARKLGCAVSNQAVGGAKFNAEIVDDVNGYKPDFITVAYGTNDWSHLSEKELIQNADAFMAAVKNQWGDIPTFSILPVWRGDFDKPRPSGSFDECRQKYKKLAEKYGFYVIDDIDLVPHFPEMFSPDMVHPNDTGFATYGSRVADFIANALNLKI